jgi:hypothetical protein
MKVLYCTADSQRELLYALEVVAQDKTANGCERFLKECEADSAKSGIPPSYWRRVKIFKVTIEEVPRAK